MGCNRYTGEAGSRGHRAQVFDVEAMGMSCPQPKRGHLLYATAAACLLLSAYWLTVSGRFHSVDEHLVFATGRNLAYHSRFDASTLFWGSPYTDLGMVGLDGEVYSKYGIGHSILVALAITAAQLLPGAGLVTTAMFLNMVATALAAFFLALTAGRIGYSAKVSFSIGLLYGLSTFALYYAKTMFSEPLVALGWAAVLWLVVRDVTWRRALLAGIVTAGVIAIRPVMALVAVPITVLIWEGDSRAFIRRAVAFVLPVAAVTVVLLAFNQLRFGNPFEFGYTERFNGSLLVGVGGFLFSLDRSIFVFAPPLIGLIWSLGAFARRHGSLGWKLLGISGFVFLLHCSWPVFWGGPVWGPRYLLPILPLLVVMLIPAVDSAWSQRGWQRIAMIILALAGIAIQLRGVIWDPLYMVQTLGQRAPQWLVRPQAAWLDIAWLYAFPGAMLLAVGIGTVAVAVLRWPRRWLVAACILSASSGSVLLLGLLGQTWPAVNEQPAYRSARSYLHDSARPGDALVLNPTPYQSPLDVLVWFLNDPEVDIPFYGVYRLPSGEAGSSDHRVDRLLGQHSRLWLLTEGAQPGDPNSTTEQYLVNTAALVSNSWLEDGYRLTLFEAAQRPAMSGETSTFLGGSALLEHWEVAFHPDRPASLQLTLHWRAQGPTTRPLHVFAQALDERGVLVAGWDGVPSGGFAASTTWLRGQLVVDRVVLTLPEGVPLEPLRLIGGLYDTTTGQRLRTPEGADAVFLGSVVSFGP